VLQLDPILLTGVEDIDRQHRELFDRVGALLEAARNHRGREEVLRLLEFLGAYVLEHFSAEERAMERTGYARLEAHRQEHRQFVKELDRLQRELAVEGPGTLLVIRVGNRVTEWLREHIYRTDRLLGDWLRGKRP
jgi:hemerythrin